LLSETIVTMKKAVIIFFFLALYAQPVYACGNAIINGTPIPTCSNGEDVVDPNRGS
jgi:hypothetical protein